MTHVTCRLTAKNRGQGRNPTVIEYWLRLPLFLPESTVTAGNGSWKLVFHGGGGGCAWRVWSRVSSVTTHTLLFSNSQSWELVSTWQLLHLSWHPVSVLCFMHRYNILLKSVMVVFRFIRRFNKNYWTDLRRIGARHWSGGGRLRLWA